VGLLLQKVAASYKEENVLHHHHYRSVRAHLMEEEGKNLLPYLVWLLSKRGATVFTPTKLSQVFSDISDLFCNFSWRSLGSVTAGWPE
jgi:hypothetical protein